MIRATTGTWLNYATTFAFQILFAARYGATSEAAAFVITFGVAVAITGILVSTVQSVAVPRLTAPSGGLLLGTLRFLAWLCVVATVIGLVIASISGPLADWLAPHLELQAAQFATLLRITALFLVLRFVAGGLGAIGLARGHRFIPAMSAALPSIIGAVALFYHHGLPIVSVYLALVAGSLLEIVFLLFTVVLPLRVVSGSARSTGNAAAAMLFVYMLLAFIAPLERVLAAAHAPADAAHYDYAIRTLRSGQQILVGGLVIATLGDWSAFAAGGEDERLRRSLMTVTVLAAVALLLTASVALVATHDAVRLVYQHGEFTAKDTDAVTRVILLALAGFCAESLVMILSSAIAALKHNAMLVFNGVMRFVGTVVLLLLFAPRWGAGAVALAYSATAVACLVALVLQVAWLRLWSHDGLAMVRRCVPLVAGTIGTAVLVGLVAGRSPGLFRAAVVGMVFLVLLYRMRPGQVLAALRA